LSTTQEIYAFTVFERVFKEFGLPNAIRTDNGVPFASPHALFGLSKLSVWWLRLGIQIERIKPGHPEQNGRHERMHLTLKKEATKPTAQNFVQQQAKFDDFIDCYNHERPHQALDMKYPAELYRTSPRPYHGLAELDYPFHDRTITITHCGRICLGKRKINLSTVFAGQNVGIKEVSDKIWLVSFMQYDLEFFDHETCRLETVDNPFEPKVLPMSPVSTLAHSLLGLYRKAACSCSPKRCSRRASPNFRRIAHLRQRRVALRQRFGGDAIPWHPNCVSAQERVHGGEQDTGIGRDPCDDESAYPQLDQQELEWRPVKRRVPGLKDGQVNLVGC
jgi:hypothetical protein